MRKIATRNEIIVGALVALFALGGIAWAAIPSFRAASLRLTGASASGTAGTAANPTLWADTTTQPNLRFGDGTADRYVPACTPTSVNDICSWNGTNWVRAAGGGGTTLQSAYTAGAAGGGAIALTSSGGPIAVTTGADTNQGFSAKANSPTQSGNFYQALDSSGNVRWSIQPSDSGSSAKLSLTSALNGSYVFMHVGNLGSSFDWALSASGTIQYSTGLAYQWFSPSFSTQYAQIDSTGIVSNGSIGYTFPDSTTQKTAGVTPLYKNVTAVNSVTTGETDAQSYTMPANTLSVDGQKIVFDAAWTHAANTNSTTYRFYVAGTALAAQTRAVSGELDTNQWTCVRASSTVLRCTGMIANAGAISSAVSSLTGLNFGSSIIIKTTVQGATANGDLTGNYLRGDLYP